jgi:uncharacterized protein YgbK (DUF1537 family)
MEFGAIADDVTGGTDLGSAIRQTGLTVLQNIGPVIERLLDDLGATFTIATPAYPDLGRTVYLGHLFVGDRLLAESSMRNRPLTPMWESDLVQVLGRQCRRAWGSCHSRQSRPARAKLGASARSSKRPAAGLRSPMRWPTLICVPLPRRATT